MNVCKEYLYYFLRVGLFLGFISKGNTTKDEFKSDHGALNVCSDKVLLIPTLPAKLVNNFRFPEIVKRIAKVVNLNECYGNESGKNSTGSKIAEWKVVTTSLNGVHHLKDNKTSVPINSLKKLCKDQKSCTVKKTVLEIKNVTVNFSQISHLSPLALSNIFVLEYVANGMPVLELEGNETVSVNFPKKIKSFTKNQLLCNSSNRRLKTLQAFPSPRAFEKASRRQAFLMLEDLGMQVNCFFLDGLQWNKTGLEVGSIDGENIQCLTNHLSTFTMVVLSKGNTTKDALKSAHGEFNLFSRTIPLIPLLPAKFLKKTGGFTEIAKRIAKVVNLNECYGNESGKNSTRSKTVVWKVLTTSLNGVHRLEDKETSIPINSLKKGCKNQQNCKVRKITLEIKNVTVNFSQMSHLSPLARSNVTVLEYVANEIPVSKLEGTESVSINFPKKIKNFKRKQVYCLFLDGLQWSKKGMEVGDIREENIECLTNHLSTFTMVVLSEIPESTDALNLISYVGCGLSLAGLFVSCIVYMILQKDVQILRSTRYLVHFNLQIALGLTQISFLAGGSYTNNKVVCMAIAILVHYFSLCGFAWIFLEALMLYLKLISVYGGEFVRIRNFLLFGWGFPCLLVALSAGMKIDAYGTEQWCWLSYDGGFQWVFFAPVIIVTLVTLVTIIAVIRVVLDVSKLEATDAKKRIIIGARGVVILFPTLGLSWGFSVIAVNHDALVWKYLFAIFTSLQGFAIFLIYGICNRKIRIAMYRKMERHVTENSGKK